MSVMPDGDGVCNTWRVVGFEVWYSWWVRIRFCCDCRETFTGIVDRIRLDAIVKIEGLK